MGSIAVKRLGGLKLNRRKLKRRPYGKRLKIISYTNEYSTIYLMKTLIINNNMQKLVGLQRTLISERVARALKTQEDDPKNIRNLHPKHLRKKDK